MVVSGILIKCMRKILNGFSTLPRQERPEQIILGFQKGKYMCNPGGFSRSSTLALFPHRAGRLSRKTGVNCLPPGSGIL